MDSQPPLSCTYQWLLLFHASVSNNINSLPGCYFFMHLLVTL